MDRTLERLSRLLDPPDGDLEPALEACQQDPALHEPAARLLGLFADRVRGLSADELAELYPETNAAIDGRPAAGAAGRERPSPLERVGRLARRAAAGSDPHHVPTCRGGLIAAIERVLPRLEPRRNPYAALLKAVYVLALQ